MTTKGPADKAIMPVILELTGGAGKLADAFFSFLAEIQLPGSKGQSKDDPRLQRRRALFVMHERVGFARLRSLGTVRTSCCSSVSSFEGSVLGA